MRNKEEEVFFFFFFFFFLFDSYMKSSSDSTCNQDYNNNIIMEQVNIYFTHIHSNMSNYWIGSHIHYTFEFTFLIGNYKSLKSNIFKLFLNSNIAFDN